MTTAPSTILVLPGALGDTGLGPRLGDWDIAIGAAEAECGFALLDDHLGTLRDAGQLLIRDDAALTLLDPERGMLTQDAGRAERFVADLDDGPVKAALGHVPPLRSLLAGASGRLGRRDLAVTDDEGKTRVRARLTTLRPDDGGPALTVAALQGLRGYDGALDRLRDHLQGAADAAPGPWSRMLMPPGDPYVAKPDIPVAEDDAAWRVATDIIATYLDVARRNEDGIIADHDTEFLHDYRVALRKVRSVLSLFRGVYADDATAGLKAAASGLMAPTGRLRDLDVYLLARDDYFAMLPASLHEGLELMFGALEKDRRAAHRRMARHLRAAPYRTQMADLQSALAAGPPKGPLADDAVGGYARGLIWKRYRKVCRIARAIDADTPDEQVHALRIACKKLRYLMEFFAPLVPASALKPVLKPLKRLQDNLGLFNDYSVQQDFLRDFMDRQAPSGDRRDLVLAQSIGALIAVLHERQREERARIMETFARFDGPRIRERARSLFHRKEAQR